MFVGQNRSREKSPFKAQIETGEEFYKDQSFSFEIEAEKQYVHRLKLQRQKIQALYLKYDSLLGELKKKDQRIKQCERLLSASDLRFKQLSLVIPELETFKHENYRLMTQNQALRANVNRIQDSYNDIIRQVNSKSNLNQQQVEKIGEINAQLSTKLRIWQQKLEDKQISFDKEKKLLLSKSDELKNELQAQKSRHMSEISMINEQLLRKEEQIDILHHQLQKFRENLIYMEQANLDLAKDHQIRLNRIMNENKQKIKAVKQEVQELSYNNEMLSNKITILNMEFQKVQQQNTSLINSACDEKKLSEQALYHLKLKFSQEKSIMREHHMQLQNKLAKVEKQLGDTLRRQKTLAEQIHRLHEGQSAKKGIRQMERRELEKINRLLLLEK